MLDTPDVRTLLLCKGNQYAIRYGYLKDYNAIYQSIPAFSERQSYQYATFGNFDAAAIYKTIVKDGHTWLSELEEDRNRITEKLDFSMRFHPIHMISYHISEEFWEEMTNYPAVVITLVYGVNQSNHQNTCDRVINNFLKNLEIDENKVKYAVYQAVNICDAIIIWATKNIPYTLQLAWNITHGGVARKTYSLPGLTLNGFCYPNLYEKRLIHEIQPCTQENECYNLRIQGSVRNHENAEELFLKEHSLVEKWISLGEKPTGTSSVTRVYGNEDFEVKITGLTSEAFVKLFINMMNSSTMISMACWEIHTEFLGCSDFCQGTEKTSTALKHPMDILLERYNKKVRSELEGKNHPWAYQFRELLITQLNIDHDPILHAPASLFVRFLDICLDFFQKPQEGMDKQIAEYEWIMLNSRENIQNILRHWGRLTEKLIWMDDLVFHGIGSIPAIHETLPESILESYHNFVRDVADVIQLPDGKGTDRKYDFLLVPEQSSQRARISEMFSQKRSECNKNKKCNECIESCDWKKPWPKEQIYLVEFSTEMLYRPESFLFPLVHECFHFFGDEFRCRKERKDRLTSLMAIEIQDYIGFRESWCKNLKNRIKAELEIPRYEGCNLDKIGMMLVMKIQELADNDFFQKLKDEDGFDYLRGKYAQSMWERFRYSFSPNTNARLSLSDSYWGRLISDWKYYFRECYADIMALLLLKMDLNIYFDLLNEEWINNPISRSKNKENSKDRFINRATLVFAVYCDEVFSIREGTSSEEAERCLNQALERYIQSRDRCDFIYQNAYEIKNRILDILLGTSRNNRKDAGYYVRYRMVCAYLKQVRIRFEELSRDYVSEFQTLRENYDSFFCKERMYTDRFNNYLNDHRKKAYEEVCKI